MGVDVVRILQPGATGFRCTSGTLGLIGLGFKVWGLGFWGLQNALALGLGNRDQACSLGFHPSSRPFRRPSPRQPVKMSPDCLLPNFPWLGLARMGEKFACILLLVDSGFPPKRVHFKILRVPLKGSLEGYKRGLGS